MGSIETEHHAPILFYDGVCAFCHATVNWIEANDRTKKLRYAPLQGETARTLLPNYGIDPARLDSLVWLEQDQAYQKTDAVARVARYLGGVYGGSVPLWFWLPAGVRNSGYDWFARNRYRLFGMKEACALPDAGFRSRMLA
jgi:predicted DCC family thiol-disulfide oxidoreductase YuxK